MAPAVPLPPPPRPVVLLFPLGSHAAAAPADLPDLLTRRLAESLRRVGLLNVTVVRDGAALPAVGEAPPAADPPAESAAMRFLSPELARLVRTERATHLMTGGIAGYVPPDGRAPGRAELRLMLVTVDGKGRREESVSVRVAGRAKSAAVAEALALAAGQLAREAFAPILAVPPAAEPRGIAALVASGQEAMEAGDLDEARRRLDTALAEAPRDPRANAAHGDLLLRLNRPAAAVSRYRQSLLFDPKNPSVRRQLLRALAQLDDREELARAAREAIDAGFEDAEAWYFLGIGCLAQGLAADAERALAESHAREPATGETNRSRALLFAITGRPAAAARLLEPSVREGDPDRAALLARVKALPGDPLARFREPLPAPESLMIPGAIRHAARIALDHARRLLPESPSPDSEEGKRRALAAAASAHELAAWWGRVPRNDLARGLQESLEGALGAIARAKAAAAVAADRPWPGAALLGARLLDAATTALRAAEGTVGGTDVDPGRAAPRGCRPRGDRPGATLGRWGERPAGRRGDSPGQLHPLSPDCYQHRPERLADGDLLDDRLVQPALIART